jgi:transposase
MAWLCRSRKCCAAIPHAGDLYVFLGAKGNVIKNLWHDGLGMSLYAKRLEKGGFIWPSPADGVIGISESRTRIHARRDRLEATRFLLSERSVQDNC